MICRRLQLVGTGPTAYYDITGGHGLANFAQGDEAIIQAVGCELRLILGEWFLDISRGVPWIRKPNAPGVQTILGAAPADLDYSRAMIKAAILGVPGVKNITKFGLSFNHSTRAATCTAAGLLVSGAPFAVSEAVL
jgi:hypothetical protein